MIIAFDPAKDQANIAKHGISLARAGEMDIIAYQEDTRSEYGETRYRAWGLIDDAYYCLAFTRRDGHLRAISLRRAHTKEIRRHVKA